MSGLSAKRLLRRSWHPSPKLAFCFVRSSKCDRADRGFSLIEVIVSLMVTLIFLSVTMQMFVSASILRAKSDRYNSAYNWMQEDYETMLAKANAYEIDAVPYSNFCNPASAASGLAANFITDTTQGLGGATTTLGPKSVGGQDFYLTRTASYAGSADPEKLVSVQYALVPVGGGASVFQLSAEVAIYAAFKCLP